MKFRSSTTIAIGSVIILIALTTIYAQPIGGMLIGRWMQYRIAGKQAELREQCPKPTVPLNANSLPIHVTVWGKTGPAVWLIPGGVQGGIGGGPATFTDQKALADRGWQVHLIDRPGFGQSPSRGPDDMDADTKLIAERLGENSNLIGHSFGGAEALLAAARRPQAISSLILVEPALTQLIAADPSTRGNPTLRREMRSIAKIMLSAKTPAEFAQSFAESLGSDTNGGPNSSALILQQHPDKAASLGCALLQARLASTVEMRQAVQTVVSAGIPVLVISGGYDKGQDATAALLAKQLHGEHVIVPSPNHFIQQSNPTVFNKLVDSFMRKAESRHHGR